MSSAFNPGAFVAPQAKPLPVVLLLDVSSSMAGPKIQVLNDAVRRMLAALAKTERSGETEFLVSVITFGAQTQLLVPPTSAANIGFETDLTADGMTPLGAALDIAKALLEDKTRTPSRAYRPLAVLVSDGEPNDDWQHRLDDFVKNGRSAKCDRMALAIGKEADRAMLGRFIAGTEHKVFEADDAEEIIKFFKFVTMSVVTRSLSVNPNAIPQDATLKALPKPATEQEPSTTEDDSGGYW